MASEKAAVRLPSLHFLPSEWFLSDVFGWAQDYATSREWISRETRSNTASVEEESIEV